MEHSYIVSEDVTIKTPGNFSMADIKSEVLEHTAEKIVRRSTYPNGFQITIEQQDRIMLIHCNQPLVRDTDGSLVAPTDK